MGKIPKWGVGVRESLLQVEDWDPKNMANKSCPTRRKQMTRKNKSGAGGWPIKTRGSRQGGSGSDGLEKVCRRESRGRGPA